MAWIFQLTNSDKTVDLNDATSHAVLKNGFQAPPPGLRTTFAGVGNLFRSGARLQAHAYENRTVLLEIEVQGSSTDVLATNVQDVHNMLRRAVEFAQFGFGSQVQLKFQWNSATTPVFFNVLTGTFDAVGPGSHGVELVVNTRLQRRRLVLVCEPFAVGSQETVENHLRDAGIEVAGTALADWTEDATSTGTSARDTGRRVEGAASLKLVMTDSLSGGEHESRYQERTAAAAEAWSVGVYADFTALSNTVAVLHAQFRDATGPLLEEEDLIDTVNTNAEQLKIENMVAPTGTTLIRYWLELRATDVDATGTLYYDQCIAVKATTVPVAWASGREVMNHFDDNGQLHINYLDLEDIPGDEVAALQIKATENEAHTGFWCGNRHAGRQRDAGIFHEGEGFAGLGTVSDANSSDANYGETAVRVIFDAASSGSSTASTSKTQSHTVASQENRLLLVFVECSDAGERTPSGVTYNAVAMTQVGSTVTNGDRSVSVWRLVAPATGANDVVATFATTCDAIILGNLSFYGVNQTTPVGTVATNTGTGTAPTVDVTAGVDDMVAAGVGIDASTTCTPGASQTERWDISAGANNAATGSTERAAGTTVTMDHTAADTGSWATAGVAIFGVGGTGTGGAAATPMVVTKAISTPPRGQYRVLARLNEQGTAPDTRAGIGYGYGGITSDPSVAAHYAAVASGNFEILDIGTLTVPPVETPESATIATFTLRLAIYDAEASNRDGIIRVDWVMLVPVDFGSMFISKTSSTDVVLVDGISDLRAAVLLNTSDVVQSSPANQGGDPPGAHPEGSRIYFASDDGAADIDNGWTVSITYEPRYLSVAGT